MFFSTGTKNKFIHAVIHPAPDRNMKLLYIDRGITAEPSEKWTWLPPETDVFLTAETVSDAREIILRELPDLIVSEVELPDGSGIGLLEWIRTEIGEGPAVILYTRSRNFEDARAAVSLKAFDYILKPDPEENLARALRQAVEYSRKTQETENRQVFLQKRDRALEEKFYRALIDGTIPGEDCKIAEMIQRLHLDVSLDLPLCIVLFDQKQIRLMESTAGRLEYERCIKQITTEKYLPYACGYVHTIPVQNHYYLTVFRRSGTLSDSMEGPVMEDCAKSINRAIHRLISAGVNIFFSGSCPMTECKNQVSRLLEMAKRCRALQDAYCTEMPPKIEIANSYSEILKQCYRYLLAANRSGLEQAVNAIFEGIRAHEDYGYYQMETIHAGYKDVLRSVMNIKNINLSTLTNQPVYTMLIRQALNGPDNLRRWIAYINEIIISVIVDMDTGNIPEKVKQFIQAHLEENITRSMLAEHVFLNEDYLSRLFHKSEGISLSQYIISEKIKKAQEWLRDPASSVTEVSMNIGIYNFPYFSQLFKKQTGLSPSEYKKQFSPK